jgi:putative DNA primase/helicase
VISAAQLLNSGLSLVPIPSGLKGPINSGWNLRQQCISDASQISQLRNGNVGLAHAYCTPTPTCAIDIDNFKLAKPWMATHGIDLIPLLTAPDAVVVWSGKRNSLKLIYRLPPGVRPLESKKINGIDGNSMVEFRCASKSGLTVQDVLPPSIHPDGHNYQWMGSGDPLQIPELPPALKLLWRLLIANACRVSTRKFVGAKSYHGRQETPRQIATIQAALVHIDANCPYDNWRNIVWAILSTGWSCAEDMAKCWSQSASGRYDEDAFWLVVNSYMPNHSSPITVGTIYHHARLGGWNG